MFTTLVFEKAIADLIPSDVTKGELRHGLAYFIGVRVPVINLHPALPGQFAGAHAIEEAYSAWLEGEITQSGCMVHHVTPELDAGEAIATRVVPFIVGDTLEIFAERLHAAEHELIVTATRSVLEIFKQPT